VVAARADPRRALAMLYLLPALLTALVLDLVARFEHDPELVRLLWSVGTWAWVWPLAVGLIKRLHDCSHSGLWAVTTLVPFVGVVPFVLIAFVAAGQADTNEHGPPPFELTDAPR
jgi:uncharacterized membrane protein YhaH (DUF805 family)